MLFELFVLKRLAKEQDTPRSFRGVTAGGAFGMLVFVLVVAVLVMLTL